jgi:O-Antigen ligase
MYALLSIFIILPLIYSHTFARLWEDFIIDNGIGNFESVKISIFLFLVCLSTLELIITKMEFFSRKTFQIALVLILWILLHYLNFGGDSIFGIGEKQHGILFFAALLWFWYLLTSIKTSYVPLFQKSIIFTALFVSFVALVEYLFSYHLLTGYSEIGDQSWWSGRATATLGNPNYVAGYLLMILPILVHEKKKWISIGGSLLLLFGILSTGSYIGMALSWLYFLYLLIKKYRKKDAVWIFLILMGIILFIFSQLIVWSEKWLSFTSRFILMKETLVWATDNIFYFLFGHGPNGIIEYYNGDRSFEVNQYFPSNMTIDSSHNLLIDIFYKFGIVAILAIAFALWKYARKLTNESKAILTLGILFFSLNVTIIVAYTLFLFACIQKSEKG